MVRRLSSLLLVAALGLGLFLGPHPCGARHEERNEERNDAQASCHGSEPAGPQVRVDEDGDDCCTAFCQHACHVTAIAEAGLPAFAISPVSGATVELSGSGLPLFAHPIDHIPLA